MGTATDGQLAHDLLLGYEPLSRHGACWYYVWQAYADAGASTAHGAIPTAFLAWEATEGRHPGDMNPPPGAAIWLGTRYDGNTDGDVFIAGAHDGDHAATDQPSWGQTGLTSIAGRMALTGREYLGWSDHVLECPITGPTPTPTPIEENAMNHLLQIDPDVDGRWFLINFGAGTAQRIHNGLQLDLIRRDPTVDQVAGPQPASVLDGLTITGE